MPVVSRKEYRYTEEGGQSILVDWKRAGFSSRKEAPSQKEEEMFGRPWNRWE